ncbi:hypothetical protein TIFTF001_030916 [Ficus carica]|uniref:O-methyltransferase C-terminal domain-containing protein n=1 Tax=Ficus carica TaxID=3494 RepID=A0AA88DVT7_FICCA|nr:hypothetical protein TIFTF001_030916 [Ficus carica]
MSTNNPDAPIMVDRMLRILASHSVLSCYVVSDESAVSNARRLYSLCPVSNYFVTNEDGVSWGPLIPLEQGKVLMDSWPHLNASTREGGVAFERTHGMNAFVYSRSDQKFNHVFNTAMYSQTTIVVKNILKFYKGFDDLKQLVDVGGGLGVFLNQITSKYPHIKGINYDLPLVVENDPSYPERERERQQHCSARSRSRHRYGECSGAPQRPRMKVRSTAAPGKGALELRLRGNIVLAPPFNSNTFSTIPDHGKVIVVDAILPIMPENSFAARNTLALDVGIMT